MSETQTTSEKTQTVNIIPTPQRRIDYLAVKLVEATFTLLRWLYTPEDAH